MDLGEEDMVYKIDVIVVKLKLLIVVKLKLLISYSSMERINEYDLFNEGASILHI